MEADWDPVAKKVVYRKKNEKSSETSKQDGQQASWRNDSAGDASPSRRRPRSYGVKPSHPVSEDIKEFHSHTTMSVIQRRTQTARASHDRQRRAYHELSSYKAFPLQELAVSYLQELRVEWGIEPDEETVSLTNLDAVSCASSTASSVTSLQPEPKRHIANHNDSLGESMQMLKDKFLQQREPSPDINLFENPLYSLEPRIWGIEAATTGKRRYIVAHAGRFFDQYWRKTIPADRHAYELIRPKSPCRLYLDIECTQDEFLISSAHLQDEVLYELWILLANYIQERFQDSTFHGSRLAPLNREDHLVDLESNSSTKFSRHWIFHLKTLDDTEVLFPNNIAVGCFVKNFISKLADDTSWQEDCPVLSKYLFLSNSCLLDMGVYTRNRIFRLLGSCKFGKSAALHIARSNQFDLGITNDCSMLRLDSSSFDDTNIDEQVQETIRRTADWSDHARALAETLVVPLNSTKLPYPLLPVAVEESSDLPKLQNSIRPSSTAHFRGQSKYPAIEEHILERFGSRGGSTGRVRVWSIFEERLLSFHMMDNRWCEHIGRQHKSNNIVWNVDLVNHTCYQTCHDPDCRGFKGEMFTIPDEVFETEQPIAEKLNDEDFFGDDEFEEALAALNIDDVVTTLASQEAVLKQDSAGLTNPPTTNVLENSGVQRDGGSQFASWLDSDDSSVDEGKIRVQRKSYNSLAAGKSDQEGDQDLDKKNTSGDTQKTKVTIADSLPCKEHPIGDSGFGRIRYQIDTEPKMFIETTGVQSTRGEGFASWLDSPDNVALNDPNVFHDKKPAGRLGEGKTFVTTTNLESDSLSHSPNTQSTKTWSENSLNPTLMHEGPVTRRSSLDNCFEIHAIAQGISKSTDSTQLQATKKGEEHDCKEQFAHWLDSPDNTRVEEVKVRQAEKFAAWLDSDSSDE